MADATTFRLDTADTALDCGWHVESTPHSDEFSRDGVTISVQYSSEDHISSIARWRPKREEEFFSHDSAGKNDRLRAWLTGRAPAAAKQAAQPANIRVGYTQELDGWTPDEFVQAVEDINDRDFLLRLLELVEANSRLPSQGTHSRLTFGKRPRGAMFVYPFGREHPPFRFFVKDGRLMISGCWRSFPTRAKGHSGFAELASMLDLDENGSETRVLVAGLDVDEVWKVGESVSRAIND